MPISVTCTKCGKKLKVPDERAGKMAKCPGCMTTFMVTPGGAAAAAPTGPVIAGVVAPPKRNIPVKPTREPTSKVSISWGFIIMIILGISVPVGIAAIVFGPVKVKGQWEEIAGDARSSVEDVVGQGLKSYLSYHG